MTQLFEYPQNFRDRTQQLYHW